jgi:hypothetical protein
MCPGQCEDIVGIEPKACKANDDYPTTLWANLNNRGKTYAEKVCCDTSNAAPVKATTSCGMRSSSVWIVIAVVVICLGIVGGGCCLYVCNSHRGDKKGKKKDEQER